MRSKSDKKKSLVPRLRFPEFREAGAWEVKRLGDVCVIRTGKKDANEGHENGIYPFFTCAENHIYSNSHSFDCEAILVAGNANVGQTKHYRGKFEAYQRTYVLTDFSDINTQYLYSYLGGNLQNDMALQVQTSAMSYIKLPMLKNYKVPAPRNPTEQQKIAHCLSSLDEVIGLQAKKVQALKQHKKGLMQQLFPAEGETTPRLRFPEFREAGAWEVKRLGEVCDVLDNLRKPVARTKRNPGPYPYYGASGAIDYIDQYIFDERLLLIGEDGAKWLPYEKTAFIVEGQYWVNNHAHVLRPTLAIDTLLENYLTALDISQHITGAAPPKLTLDNLRLIWVPLPPKRDEQQKIAHCLSSLDEVIGLESHKLDALKNLKKGLMQQLFP
uniref:restriction endonuclease subunit S n=2 Tax=Thiolapillus sp. TaxID=2017437 RepID=UPI003AF6F28F